MFEHTKQGAVDIISGDCSIDFSSVKSIQSLANECMAFGQPQLVIDMTNVPLLDSKGLETLLEVHEECTRRGGVVRLAAPSNLCRDILDIGQISSMIEVCPDVTSAVGGFAK